MRAITRSITLPAAVSATSIISEVAEELVRLALAEHRQERLITLLAVSVSHLERQPEIQLELSWGNAEEAHLPGTQRGAARWSADRAMDRIRERFGWDAVGYASVVLEAKRSIPDAFRELAAAQGWEPIRLWIDDDSGFSLHLLQAR